MSIKLCMMVAHVPLPCPAVPLENGVHGNDHHVVHGDDDKGGQADGEDGTDRFQPVTAEGDAHRRPPSKEEEQHIDAGGELGEHCGQSRPLHPHVQQEDEHGVQHDVEHRAQEYRTHGDVGKALTDDKLVES